MGPYGFASREEPAQWHGHDRQITSAQVVECRIAIAGHVVDGFEVQRG